MSPAKSMRAAVAAAMAAASLCALAQSNPVARGTINFRHALQDRLGLDVTERAITAGSPFPATCGDHAGTLYIGAEVEPHIAVNPLDPNHLVAAWQQDRYSNGGARGQAYGFSFDGGATWTRGALPVSTCAGGQFSRATDPWVSFSPDGTVHQISLGFTGQSLAPGSSGAVLAARSTDGGRTWSTPIAIASTGSTLFDDKETITADPLDSRFVYAAWDRLLNESISATMFARSTDGGATWEPARELYRPPQGGGTIANLVRVLPDGTLVNMFMQLVQPAGIYLMRSTDRGVTWSAPVLAMATAAVGAEDEDSGAFIRDGDILPQMAVGPDGALHLVWQDARFSQDVDGIAYSRSDDRGVTWTTPVRVNSVGSVPAFTPQVHVRADGTVGVTYYDLRSNTADKTTLPTDFWLARSTDGVTWTETHVAGPFDLATAPNAGGLFVGDYTGLVSAGTTFIAAYGRTTGDLANRTDIFVTRIAPPSLAFGQAKDAYRAQEMPQAEAGPAFWQRVEASIRRAREARYLKLQRYTASSPGR